MGWNHQLDHFKSTFQSELRFRSRGFSWNHPSKSPDNFVPLNDLTPSKNTAGCLDLFVNVFSNKKKEVWKPFPFKTNNRTKTWLTFLVRYLIGNHFISQKNNLYPTKKKAKWLFYPFLHLVFTSKKNGLRKFYRHKVLPLGYANVVTRVPHISRMWPWWVWKNRRPLEEHLWRVTRVFFTPISGVISPYF